MAEQITEAAKHRASELIKAEYPPNVLVGSASIEEIDGHYWGSAFARYIMQVSDVAKDHDNRLSWIAENGTGIYLNGQVSEMKLTIRPFILNDPLFDAVWEAGLFSPNTTNLAIEHTARLRAELAKRGLQIVPSNG